MWRDCFANPSGELSKCLACPTSSSPLPSMIHRRFLKYCLNMKGMSGDRFPLTVVSIIYFILCSTAQLQAVFLLNYWRTRPTSQWRPSQMLPGVKKQKSNFFRAKNPGPAERWATADWWDARLLTGLPGLSMIGISLLSTQSFEIHFTIPNV